MKTSKSTALLTSSTMSLSGEPSGCLHEWVCVFKLPSSLPKMVRVAFSALHLVKLQTLSNFLSLA